MPIIDPNTGFPVQHDDLKEMVKGMTTEEIESYRDESQNWIDMAVHREEFIKEMKTFMKNNRKIYDTELRRRNLTGVN